MYTENDRHQYGDTINLPHHQSATRPHMSIHDRAAQFAPFAMLTGYGAAVAEAARQADEKIELDEYKIVALDARLQPIREHIAAPPAISVTCFCPDDKKSGGVYLTKTARERKWTIWKGSWFLGG